MPDLPEVETVRRGLNQFILHKKITHTKILCEKSFFGAPTTGKVIKLRRFGKALQLDGGAIVACGSGYFDCEVSITVAPTVAGSISAQLYQDGLPVPGAIATGSVSTAGNPVTLPISALVRNCGCECNSTLSVRVNASCTLSNLACVVEKI